MNTVAVFESEAFNHTDDAEEYCVVIAGDGEGEWTLVVERPCGLLPSLFGGRHRNVGRSGLAAIEDALSRSDRVENLRWVSWKEFRDGGVLAA